MYTFIIMKISKSQENHIQTIYRNRVFIMLASQHIVILFKLLLIFLLILKFPNLSPPRALKPHAPNSTETWALGLVCCYIFSDLIFLLLIIKNEKFPIDLHWLRKIAPLEEQFPSGGAEWLDQFHFYIG